MAHQSRQHFSTLGPYRLLRLIGFGPISYLYLVQHESGSEDSLVLKLIETPSSLFQAENQRLFFLQEVDRFMHLSHPSILPLRDAGIYEGNPYLVYPYVKAGSLAYYLALLPIPKLPLGEALTLIAQLGNALEKAHQEQLVHGNLKPSNIFLLTTHAQNPTAIAPARRVAAIADFHLETLARSRQIARQRASSSVRYMAPEQFWGAFTAWGDQYSLACLAYELLTGKAVFAERDFSALRDKHVFQPPVPPGQFIPNFPRPAEEALLKALSKRVGDRYPSIRAFLTALTGPFLPPEMAHARLDSLKYAPEPQPFISSNRLILPLLPGENRDEIDSGNVTERVVVLPGKRDTTRIERGKRFLSERWQELQELVRSLLYGAFVFCSWLVRWFGELWSLILLLFLVLRDRQKLWRSIQEESAHHAVIHPPRGASLWQTTIVSAWQRGIWHSRRRWNRVLRRMGSRPRAARRARLLLVCAVLSFCLCLVGALLLLNLAGLFPSGSKTNSHASPTPLRGTMTPGRRGTPTSSGGIAPIIPALPTPTPTPTPTPPVRVVPLPKPTPTPTPTPTPARTAYACQIHYQIVTQWPGGFEVEFTLWNTGTQFINGWVLRFSFLAGQHIYEGWNGRFSQYGDQVSIFSLSYNASLPPGSMLNAPPGFNATWQGYNPAPPSFTLNGTRCQTI